MSDEGKRRLDAPLTVHEAIEIKRAHLAFEGAGGSRSCLWSYKGFP